MKQQGFAYKFADEIADNICAEYIFAKKYILYTKADQKLTSVLFQAIDPNFFTEYSVGEILVAGYNFGSGPIRERIFQVMKAAGINIIIAKSFASFFYRAAFSAGFLLLEANTDFINDKDEIEIMLKDQLIRNLTRRIGFVVQSIPKAYLRLYNDGGILAHLHKHGLYNLV